MIKKILGSKKVLFWSIFVLVILICLITLGATFAWMYDDGGRSVSNAGAGGVGLSMSVDGVINFQLNPEIVGISGDVVEVTSINEILTGSYTDPYIFRVEYMAKGNTAASMAGMRLSPEKVAQLGLIEHGSVVSENKVTAVYYGLNSSVTDLDMGPLQVAFQDATNDNADDDLYINVEVISCQRTKEAFKDAYGITDKDLLKFLSLLEQ